MGETNKVNVFVYGTLRPGDYNHSRFGEIGEVIKGVKAKGRLYHAIPSVRDRVYPGARFDEDGTIVGDILVLDKASTIFREIHRMEIGAGYSCVEIVAAEDNGYEYPCLSYQYERTHGERIRSGDWFAADAWPTPWKARR